MFEWGLEWEKAWQYVQTVQAALPLGSYILIDPMVPKVSLADRDVLESWQHL